MSPVTATITRHRRARADSSWRFEVASDFIIVTGDVKVPSGVDDMGYETAGWRVLAIVEAIVGELTDLPVDITYAGLPPHPAAAKAEPQEPTPPGRPD
jgi:Ni,Fe-hydrogenase III small subunit